mgnify:CR=1 FL=1
MQARKLQRQMMLILMIMPDYIARNFAGNIFFVKKALKKEKIKHIESRTFFCEKKEKLKYADYRTYGG